MFEFGKNWASFSKQIEEENIKEAKSSLAFLFGEGALAGKTFLDVGCGSGLFSIAAARLGAKNVLGVDVDKVSVETSRHNSNHWLVDYPNISFVEGSALNADQMSSLGTFDVVYSWGVLHHTGDMLRAIKHVTQRVKRGGLLMIAIYNRHSSSTGWWVIKWLYNQSNKIGQKVLIWLFAPIIFIAKWMATGANPLKMRRGMDFMHNVIDWVGGYPYEYASIDEMLSILRGMGFDVIKVIPTSVPTGCNEFVCKQREE